MITLFHAPSSCSLAIKAALALTGIEYRSVTINLASGEQLTPEFKRISPLGKVPVVEIDGRPLTEGAAILLYLAEQAPKADLVPPIGSPERAEAYRWLMFLYTNVHAPFARAFVPGRYGEDHADIKRKAEAALFTLFEIIEQQLAQHKYIAGSVLTLPDLYLVVTVHWQKVLSKKLTDAYPNLSAYTERMLTEPVIGEIYRNELAA